VAVVVCGGLGSERKTPVHGAAHGARMGPHGAGQLPFSALALGQQPTGTAICHQGTLSLLIYLLLATTTGPGPTGRGGAQGAGAVFIPWTCRI
jgi:hypothetical protein